MTLKKAYLFLVSIIVAASFSGCAAFYPTEDPSVAPVESANPNPSTSESPSEPTQSESPSAAPDKSVAEPTVLFFEITGETLLIVGEVVNVSEDGGVCTITFFFDNKAVLAEKVSSESNVSTTQCAPLEVPLSALTKGSGYAVIGYESEKYEGQSEKFKVEIP